MSSCQSALTPRGLHSERITTRKRNAVDELDSTAPATKRRLSVSATGATTPVGGAATALLQSSTTCSTDGSINVQLGTLIGGSASRRRMAELNVKTSSRPNSNAAFIAARGTTSFTPSSGDSTAAVCVGHMFRPLQMQSLADDLMLNDMETSASHGGKQAVLSFAQESGGSATALGTTSGTKHAGSSTQAELQPDNPAAVVVNAAMVEQQPKAADPDGQSNRSGQGTFPAAKHATFAGITGSGTQQAEKLGAVAAAVGADAAANFGAAQNVSLHAGVVAVDNPQAAAGFGASALLNTTLATATSGGKPAPAVAVESSQALAQALSKAPVPLSQPKPGESLNQQHSSRHTTSVINTANNILTGAAASSSLAPVGGTTTGSLPQQPGSVVANSQTLLIKQDGSASSSQALCLVGHQHSPPDARSQIACEGSGTAQSNIDSQLVQKSTPFNSNSVSSALLGSFGGPAAGLAVGSIPSSGAAWASSVPLHSNPENDNGSGFAIGSSGGQRRRITARRQKR